MVRIIGLIDGVKMNQEIIGRKPKSRDVYLAHEAFAGVCGMLLILKQ